MQIGIIAEGKSDVAVITNVLKGVVNIDTSDIFPLLPELEFDETDLYEMRIEQFSNWTLVKESCENREKFDVFLNSVDEERYIVIQIDTAERFNSGYDIPKPIKPRKDFNNYSEELRNNVVEKINFWLQYQYSNKLFYAVAIEETEAWILPLYDNFNYDTSKINTPKEKIFSILNKAFSKKERNRILKNENMYQKYLLLSKGLTGKLLNNAKQKNKSLELFCDSLMKLT